MKILVVVPWAPSAIRPRSLGLISQLARQHSVSVVGAVWSEEDEADLKAMGVEHVASVRLTKIGAAWRCFLALFSRGSLQQAYVDAPSLRRAIRREAERFKPDLAYFNVIRSAQFVNEVGDVPSVLDLDEFRSAYYGLLAQNSRNILWRLIARAEGIRMQGAERRALDDFSRVIVSSPTDLRTDQPHVRLVRSPHALHTDPAPIVNKLDPGSIVFVGRQSYRANAEAVLWFVNKVLPRVLLRVPFAHLTIVGDAPPPRVLKLAGPRIAVTGRVDDLTAFYTSAAVSVIPVRMATGVQMKLIESMALGAPVVATPIVARGAGVDESHCHIADTVDEWVDRVVDLLLNAESRDRLTAGASGWVNEAYSAGAISDSLDAVLSGVWDDRGQELLS
jgi:glycosyltransferase involved in cell wall biosynthesis